MKPPPSAIHLRFRVPVRVQGADAIPGRRDELPELRARLVDRVGQRKEPSKTLGTMRVIILLFALAAQAIAQTAIHATQIACPASLVPVVAVAIPPAPGGAPKTTRVACIPLDAKSFVVDTSVTPPVIRAIGATFVDAETPAGAIDGQNATYTLAAAPSPAASLALFRNGVLQRAGSDYTLSGLTIVFAAASVPQPGDTLLANYRK